MSNAARALTTPDAHYLICEISEIRGRTYFSIYFASGK